MRAWIPHRKRTRPVPTTGRMGTTQSCLRNREVAIEDPDAVPLPSHHRLKPEAIPVDPKSSGGSAWAYYLLYNADEDFRRIFRVWLILMTKSMQLAGRFASMHNSSPYMGMTNYSP